MTQTFWGKSLFKLSGGAPRHIAGLSSFYLLFISLLREKGKQTGGFGLVLPGDPGGLTGSRCSSYETVSCFGRKAFRILAKLCTGGRTSWERPEPFRKGDSGLSSGRGNLEEEERKRELGKERGSQDEKMIQPANKLLNEHRENKDGKSNFHTGKMTVNCYHS